MGRSFDKQQEADFDRASAALIERAGGVSSLADAAQNLGISTQALRKRIRSGSVLAIVVSGRLVVANLQMARDPISGRHTVLKGIRSALQPFLDSGAGPWMAIEFLSSRDPNLGREPIDCLRAGRVGDVVKAAAAYLH